MPTTPPETPPGSDKNGPETLPEPKVLTGKKDSKKKKKASKSAETLFRTTLSNHIRLSEMADRKANLMISVNTIVISVVLSAYVRRFDAPATLLIPSILLLVVCLGTIVLSLTATNPTIAPARKWFAKPDEPPVDLLFFGYYSQLTADEYRRELRELLRNEEDIYTSLIDNLYAQGRVLARKYRLLKWAYQFFTVGFTAVVLFAIAGLLVTY